MVILAHAAAFTSGARLAVISRAQWCGYLYLAADLKERLILLFACQSSRLHVCRVVAFIVSLGHTPRLAVKVSEPCGEILADATRAREVGALGRALPPRVKAAFTVLRDHVCSWGAEHCVITKRDFDASRDKHCS